MQDKYFNLDLINELSDNACNDPERLLRELGVNARLQGRKYAGPCPVHDGDNPGAFNFYYDGETVRGFWKCRTHECHTKWKKNLPGLIQGIKTRELGRPFSWKETVDWLVKFNGIGSVNQVKLPDITTLKKRSASRIISKLNITLNQKQTGWSREWVRQQLQIPSQYYVDRGYSKKILDKYDVGLYPSQNRISVPVYDENYKFCVGFAARSIFEQCKKCSLYHRADEACPTTTEGIASSAKWRNSRDFDSGSYFYNYWFAKNHILKSGVAALVEGSGDVWRLEENDIHIGLGMFGVELTDQQRLILDKSGVLSLIILLDNDEAGKKAAIEIKKKLYRSYRLYFPKIHGDDVGELHTDAITNDIKPYIQMLENK